MSDHENMYTEEYADLARTNPATIRYWRHIKYGPAGFKLGRRVLYSRLEVLAWIEKQRVTQGGNVA